MHNKDDSSPIQQENALTLYIKNDLPIFLRGLIRFLDANYYQK